uniref:tetraspanin-8-like n=1 Tax=Ciona intestinalis TaxID=7719 RepID=UPI000EF53E70|nr:tetraspanin-8-like [Ciona intestinalis]|eukprot:XP_026692259.1 tetraspanin-8-like [Ciona intestinalis]
MKKAHVLLFLNLVLSCVFLSGGAVANSDIPLPYSLQAAGFEDFTYVYGTFYALGILIYTTTILGCEGLDKTNSPLDYTNIGMLLALTVIEFVLGVVALSSRYNQMEYKIYNNIVVVSLTKESHFHHVRTQQILECCGATRGCQDWSTKSSSYGCGCVPKSMSNDNSTDPDCVLAHSVDCGPDTATSSVYVYKKVSIVTEV